MGAKQMLGAAMAAWVVSGCGMAESETLAPSLETSTAAVTRDNGPQLNGINPNGTLMNQRLVSVRYDGARREGMSAPFDMVWLEASEFHGLMDTEELSGADFARVRFVGELESGATVPLRIEGVTPGSGLNQNVWSYKVSYLEPMDGQWHSLCQAADGTPTEAIALEGYWNYGQGVAGGGSKILDNSRFTFACDGFALAKCVRFGYQPWTSIDGVNLEAHHQACTRMLRADFCGDGTPHTMDGNLVNVYDALNVQADTVSWQPEAEWNSEGAACFTSQNRSTTQIQCANGKLVDTCATGFSSGTLIISEIPGAQP